MGSVASACILTATVLDFIGTTIAQLGNILMFLLISAVPERSFTATFKATKNLVLATRYLNCINIQILPTTLSGVSAAERS